MEFFGHTFASSMQHPSREGHALAVDADGAGELALISFEGDEALSTPFSFELTVATAADPAALEHAVLGAEAALTLALDDDERRVVRGVIDQVRVGLRSPAGGLGRVCLRLVPRVALAAHRRDTRIFQDLSIPEVLARVLRAHDVELAWRVEAPATARPYCVQYEETDLDFTQRLLAEEGVTWFTESSVDAGGRVVEALVCVDVPSRWREMEGGSSLALNESGAMVSSAAHVRRFEGASRVSTGAVAMRGYDVSLPAQEHDAAAQDPHRRGRSGELYLHHDEGQEPDVRRSRARHRLAQAQRDAEVASGESDCPRLRPGAYFTLTDHPLASLDRRWVPTRVRHEGRNADTEGYAVDPEGRSYGNAFECVPAERSYPPAIPARRVLQVTETATVVGPAGEDICTDALGRVRVRFHWDRRGRAPDSSCWMPVAQLWAGAGWGAQFIPRVGMEVLVTFIGGDPDRPMIVGCLPSASAPPPFSLPEHRTRSGLRTQSTPDGSGGHELVFEDLGGQEFIELSSRRDLRLRGARDGELVAGQDLTITAGASLDVTARADHDLRVEGAMRTRVGGERVDVTGGARLSEVEGRRGDVIAGDWTAEVGGAMHLGVRGDVSLVAGGVDPATLTLRAEGDVDLSAEARVEITAREEIVLRCGSSAIVITPDGVEIRASRVTVTGESGLRAEGGAAGFALGDDEALVSAKRVRLYSDGASVTLDRDAHVRGREVLLNCDDDPRPDAPSDPRETPRVPLRLRVTDAALNPLAHKPFHVFAAGETLKGETDAEGWVRARIAARASTARVTVWSEAYPSGARREWTVSLGALAPVESARGQKERLRNLGWYDGAVDDQADDALTQAVRDFQHDHGMPSHGAVDDATRAKLASLHGA